jgi:hypothetical protein
MQFVANAMANGADFWVQLKKQISAKEAGG